MTATLMLRLNVLMKLNGKIEGLLMRVERCENGRGVDGHFSKRLLACPTSRNPVSRVSRRSDSDAAEDIQDTLILHS